jgi:hypothetical protein
VEKPLGVLWAILSRERKTAMKRQLETATEVPPELESRVGAESTPRLPDASGLLSGIDAELQALVQADAAFAERRAERKQVGILPTLRLLWAGHC